MQAFDVSLARGYFLLVRGVLSSQITDAMPDKIIFFILTLFLVATTSCTSTREEKQRQAVKIEVADVYINDDFRGTTPGTIRVHRGRKELSVTLKHGKTIVRSFTLEEFYSQNTAEVVYSVSGTRPDGTLTFNVEDLPSRDKMNYVIPYFEERLTIEDNKYDLTIIVVD